MKQFLLIKKDQTMDIPGNYVVVYRGVTYPLSKKSNIHAETLNVDGGIQLNEERLALQTKLRRAKVGDTVHVLRIPPAQFEGLPEDCSDLNGKIVESNNDNVTVQLTNCGLSAKILILKKMDIELTNISNTHKISYLLCQECGTILH